MTRWIVAAVVVLAVAAALGLYLRPSSVPTVDPAHERRAAEDVQQVEQKDVAIRSLSAEIARLRTLADREGQARAAAEQRASAFAERARDLSGQLTRIEAERKALARATTTEQVREALARRGIVAR